MKKIFITVGTTLFNQLIETISDQKFIQNALTESYNQITIQYGKGKKPHIMTQQSPSNDDNESNYDIKLKSYDFKPSLQQDMISSDLIISHAGAGSIMEGLILQKKLVVVINNLLMNNHQYELADALYKRGYLICVHDPKKLWDRSFWDDVECFIPKKWKGGDDVCFGRLLDDQMGHFVINDSNDDKMD